MTKRFGLLKSVQASNNKGVNERYAHNVNHRPKRTRSDVCESR